MTIANDMENALYYYHNANARLIESYDNKKIGIKEFMEKSNTLEKDLICKLREATDGVVI